MFPPETIATVLPPSARPARRSGRRERARALRDHAHPLGDQPDRGGGVLDRDDEGAVDRLATYGHIVGHADAARPVDEGLRVLHLRRPAGRERGAGRWAVLRIHGEDLTSGRSCLTALAIPTESPPPPYGHEHGVQVGQVFDELQPDRPVPGHHALVLDRVHEEPVDALEARVDDRLPPLLLGHLDHAAAEALDPSSFVCGAPSGR